MQSPSADMFFVRYRGRVSGPIDRETLLEQARSGRITSLYEVSTDQISWRRLRDWQELHDVAQPPPPAPTNSEVAEQIRPDIGETSPPPLSPTNEGPPAAVVFADPNAWFYRSGDGAIFGPIPPRELLRRLQSGRLGMVEVSRSARGPWNPAHEVADQIRNDAGLAMPQPYVPPPTQPVGYSAPAVEERTNGLAVGGFVCSLVGLFIFGFLCLIGLILCASALSRPNGRGLAWAGIIIGILGTLGWLVILVAALGK